VVKVLEKAKIKAEAIHGNKSQNARQRALSNFKDQSTRVLVATDIAARGIDISSLAFVVNFEIPNIAETYVHRIGRTGRAGASGKAISFCDATEKGYLKDIEKLIQLKIPVVFDHPYPLMDHDAVEEKPQQGRHRSQEGNQRGQSNSKSTVTSRNSSQKRKSNERSKK